MARFDLMTPEESPCADPLSFIYFLRLVRALCYCSLRQSSWFALRSTKDWNLSVEDPDQFEPRLDDAIFSCGQLYTIYFPWPITSCMCQNFCDSGDLHKFRE